MHYVGSVPESSGGLYLIRRGDFNAGAHINCFVRVHCHSAAPGPLGALLNEKRHATFFGEFVKIGSGYVVEELC